MNCLDLTLAAPPENLACDEALLDFCEEHRGEPVLRFWESPSYFVAVGYANFLTRETHWAACQAQGIPLLRRCSGGGAVLQGPGCLNYALILPLALSPDLLSISQTNRFIMEQHRAALAPLFPGRPVAVQGHTDLTLDQFKFSGNAQRRRRECLLFHGTFLLEFNLDLIEKYLLFPSKTPDYRLKRPHRDFLTNLNIPASAIKAALRAVWQANAPPSNWPQRQTELLVQTKYSLDEWNLKFR